VFKVGIIIAILEKSVKNCDRESAHAHTQVCQTPDIGHRTSDTADDFIFCPMLLCIAFDRQKPRYFLPWSLEAGPRSKPKLWVRQCNFSQNVMPV